MCHPAGLITLVNHNYYCSKQETVSATDTLPASTEGLSSLPRAGVAQRSKWQSPWKLASIAAHVLN